MNAGIVLPIHKARAEMEVHMKTTHQKKYHDSGRHSVSSAYIESLRELAIDFFSSAPFGLDRKQARVCAGVVLKAVQQHGKAH